RFRLYNISYRRGTKRDNANPQKISAGRGPAPLKILEALLIAVRVHRTTQVDTCIRRKSVHLSIGIHRASLFFPDGRQSRSAGWGGGEDKGCEPAPGGGEKSLGPGTPRGVNGRQGVRGRRKENG